MSKASQYQQVAIVCAKRTGVGKFMGSLQGVPAYVMGAEVIKAMLAETKVPPDAIDEVIIGQVLTGGQGQCPARQSAIKAGLPHKTTALTINKVCGSGLKAMQLGAQAIVCGDAEIVIAGGQENMSMAPHVVPNSRNGQRMGEWKLIDTMITDGLWCAFNNYHMGMTAENIASDFGLDRAAQDAFALASQQKAAAAVKSNRFKDQIVPMAVGKGKVFATDEFVKLDATADGLAKLKPAFKSKDGTVTAGNASGLNDGAALVMMMSVEKAKSLGLEIMATVRSFAAAGVDPRIMGTGPIPASKKALERANWTVKDLELIESNEAFASQALSVNKELGWDTTKVNVNGGAISIGHPIGASGSRIAVDLLHEMRRRGLHRGLATLCIGGGQGVAMCFEVPAAAPKSKL
mmetsp:Transcript_43137/g.125620  ORF Transcript_43137/g.125620 Transcript_43137/m.125620 type:complete len:405 (-) Transcript_43137:243-1457(-)